MTPLASIVLVTLLGSTHGGPPVPAIEVIETLSGPIGSEVVISGTGFGASVDENRISFGGVDATIVSASETRLVVTVPVAARFSRITVMSNGLMARSSDRFNITFDATEPLDGSHLDDVVVSPYFGSGVITLAVGDLDDDGKPEIVTVQGYGDVHVHTVSFDDLGRI